MRRFNGLLGLANVDVLHLRKEEEEEEEVGAAGLDGPSGEMQRIGVKEFSSSRPPEDGDSPRGLTVMCNV